jgi:hypothetical protein
MRTEQEVRERLARHERDLAGWREPGGHLVRTAADPEERRRIREGIEITILALRWVLTPDEDLKWPTQHTFKPWQNRPWCGECGRSRGDPLHIYVGPVPIGDRDGGR